ncbi:hypothetical protein [Nonomuraea pusilla]|uniref:hypothetical protein n=1 Tax=Nonomuraea pusilla TaxID=46177 RepID=UPI001160A7DB|nr:hypothetical protein [Nonomuraea pusilla]
MADLRRQRRGQVGRQATDAAQHVAPLGRGAARIEAEGVQVAGEEGMDASERVSCRGRLGGRQAGDDLAGHPRPADTGSGPQAMGSPDRAGMTAAPVMPAWSASPARLIACRSASRSVPGG